MQRLLPPTTRNIVKAVGDITSCEISPKPQVNNATPQIDAIICLLTDPFLGRHTKKFLVWGYPFDYPQTKSHCEFMPIERTFAFCLGSENVGGFQGLQTETIHQLKRTSVFKVWRVFQFFPVLGAFNPIVLTVNF